MVHRQIEGNSLGRLAIPFLLLLLVIYADARIIRCGPDGCQNPSLAQQSSSSQRGPQDGNGTQALHPLAFPFSDSFLNGPAAPPAGPVEVSEPEPARAAPSRSTSPSRAPTSAAAPASQQSQDGPVAPPRLPTDREVTQQDVDAFVLQAQRYFRAQQIDRRNVSGDHPGAGGAGTSSDGTGQPSGDRRTAPDGPPLQQTPQLPGGGDPGETAPGQLGEPAGGFLE